MNHSMKFFQAILLLISVVIFLLVIYPKQPEIERLEKERNEFEIVRAAGNELKEKKEELISRFSNIPKEEIERLENFLPDTVDNVRLLVDLDAIAKRKRLNITNITIDTQEATQKDNNDKSKLGKVSISFSVILDYTEMKELLVELEESLRIVDVRKVEITSSQETETFPMKLTIDTYWLR